jgi:hypothetical protein
MADLGIQLTFVDSETSVAFSRALKVADAREKDFRVATFDSKLNVDAATLLLVLKFAGPAFGAVAGFVNMTLAILKVIKRPSVKIEIDGKTIELDAKASDDDVKELCAILLRSGK